MSDSVNLARLLAEALKSEFGMMLNGGDEDWLKASVGILEKMDAAMQTPKQHPIQYTDVEINMVDQQLISMGWDFTAETRFTFLKKYQDRLDPAE